MSTARRMAKNTALLFASQIISYVIGFFAIMYTARYLGPENFGILSLALAFTGIFGVFADLGLNTLIVREVSRDKSLANQYLVNTTLMKVFLAFLTIILVILTVNLAVYPLEVCNVIYIITASVIFNSFAGIFNSIFQAYEKMEYQSVATILNSIIMIVGVMLAISYGYDVTIFASIYLIISLIILLYNIIIFNWQFFTLRSRIDWNFWKPTIKEALPFGLSGLFVTIYYWIDSVMLSLMVNNEVVGWYNASYRIIMVFLFIPTILNIVIFPIMSQFYINSKESLRFSYEKYFKYMVILGIPLGLGTTLLANRIILLIFGVGYTNSIIALQILVWSSVVIFINGSFGRLLEASNRQGVVTKITAICAVGNIILNLILIPKFSYVGASVVTVITEFTSLLLGLKASSSMGYSLSQKEGLCIIKTIFASIIMGLFIVYFKDMNLLIITVLSTLIYLIVLYLMGGFDDEDIQLIKGLIK